MRIGIDIVEVDRIKRLVKNQRFLEKVFSQEEIDYCKRFRNSEIYYAARFAAKEAFIKATGKRLKFKDIKVLNKDDGSPFVVCGDIKAEISISHVKKLAVAVCIVEG